MEITATYQEPYGFAETWVSGKVVKREPVIYGTTEISVDGEPVSQWKQDSEAQNGFEACDYETGAIYQNLFEMDAQRLAYQIAQSYAYRITGLKEEN